MTANLEELRRTLAAQIAPAIAPVGWQYVRLCPHCVVKNPVGDHMCTCVEPCSHLGCPSMGVRSDPCAYSEGFVFPPVPTFEGA